ncbi:hypothetical protein PN499_15475 [Kamptonema animale CS-326]|uniref:hypothetical protein n=1 Tax=Kamptonema animale TaxID=92934 RepID=UPI00232F2A14|nr:hypothetical protein [Kamptonema animale]MDB9512588.1 hypothetical protein [Kamptonema animale CS-326]
MDWRSPAQKSLVRRDASPKVACPSRSHSIELTLRYINSLLLFSNGTGLILACYLRAPTTLTDSLRADLSTHASDRTVL